MAGSGTAAKEDGMSRTQYLFFTHVQHLASNVACGTDAAASFGSGARFTAAMGAKGAVRQVCLRFRGYLLEIVHDLLSHPKSIIPKEIAQSVISTQASRSHNLAAT